jgi:HD-GYP domain-containing protein (c-di-GMP phosphodiesterase class II)
MKLDLNELLLAVSFSLDFVEMDVLGASSNHSKRVAVIAMQMGRSLGMSREELFDLCSFSILHDNGIAEEELRSERNIRPEEKGKIQGLEKYWEHCNYGERNIAAFPFKTGQKDIIRYHHERYDGSGFFGLQNREIPLMAQIIALADTTDNLFHFEREEIGNREEVRRFISDRRGSWFDPEIVDVFLALAERPAFWLDLQNQFINYSVREIVPSMPVTVEWQDVYEITKVFSQIIDSKSKYTYNHSSGLVEKVCAMADYYAYDTPATYQLCIAAHLHDLGKLAVPNCILDKPGRLDRRETEIVRAHTFYTRKALEQLSVFENLALWAANHHERLDGSGYPYQIDAEGLAFEDRLLMILDVYQALTESRPYRQALDSGQALHILRENAEQGKLDSRIVEDVVGVFARDGVRKSCGDL